jgi:ATP-binding cassette subfamily F protein uup
VDHIFVFHGSGNVQDFPGNYTQYRLEAKGASASLEDARKTGYSLEVKSTKTKTEQKRRLSFKEKKELEELEVRMPELEAEKATLEALLSGGATLPDDIAKASKRYQEVQEELDNAEMRWLELSEIG